MELNRKQTILLIALSAAALLLIAGLGFWIAGSAAKAPIPTEPPLPDGSPSATNPPPSATPTAVPTPTPTPYRLPLVPDADAGTIKDAPKTVQADAAPAGVRREARAGVYTSEQKEFLAIGTLSGEAIAVLLVQVKPPRAAVLALPCETLLPVYTLSADCTVLRVDTAPVKEATARAEGVREGCWNLIWAIKNGTGYQAPAYLCVDFACMESFFAYAPQTETASGPFTLKAFRQAIAESGETRARHMGELGVGAVKLLSKVSLWELPGFRNATRDSFSSSLSILELFSLLHTLRAVEQYSVDVLQTVPTDAGPVLNPADIPF